jgi:hypothetical protein
MMGLRSRAGELRAICLVATIVVSSALGHAQEAPRLRYRKVSELEFACGPSISDERLDELARHVGDVQQLLEDELALSTSAALRIFVFDSRREFAIYVQQRIPSVSWAQTAGRHGIFLLRDGQPYIFMLDSDDGVRSLRHEIVHAVLNSACPGVPIWFDEGLAQCYESADGSHHSERAAKLLKSDWLHREPPTVAELSKPQVMSQMSPRLYAGAWHHLSRLLDSEDGRLVVRQYLAAIRDGETAPALAP